MLFHWHRCHFLLWTRNQQFDFVYLAGKSGEPEISAVEEEGQVISRFFGHLYLPISGAEVDGGVYGLAMERLQHLIDLGGSFTVVVENHIQLAGVETESGGAVLLRNAGNTRKEYGKHFPSTWISRRHCLDIRRRRPGVTPDRKASISSAGAGIHLTVTCWFFIRATVREMGVPVSGASSYVCSPMFRPPALGLPTDLPLGCSSPPPVSKINHPVHWMEIGRCGGRCGWRRTIG
ncbi:uncharacterized protein LOC120350992 [Nilaparvata lugens]|uniref:uncharacterized protein LOC120350992 n=1 Tax=Nilaparvata lugens TaxID=108931 RepID=UPI00193CEEE4|nr:uncharacterized protein LOC120350992 [Nilaparvata lugens]